MTTTFGALSPIESLRSQVSDRTAVIGVVGLGYVGLPVAVTFAGAGFEVLGVDRDESRIVRLGAGENPIGGAEPGLDELIAQTLETGRFSPTTDYSQLGRARIITINVDTPVDSNREPNYQSLISACQSIAHFVQPGTLVIVESTVSPGTTQSLVIPRLLEGSGLRLNRDLFVGVCPERVMPGHLLRNIRKVPRICGGSSPDVADLMCHLYSTIVEADLDNSDILTAELVKVTENTYRDVQIAFANEIAMVCDDLGIDVWTVRQLVNKVPFRDMHRPGGGVGGHCLPKDPWLLAAAASRSPLRLIPAARLVNDSMPLHIAEQITARIEKWQAAEGHAGPISVAVLGYSYLPESDDVRNTPSESLVTELMKRGFQVRVHDPFVSGYHLPLELVLDGCHAVVIMVAHTAYDHLKLPQPVVLRVGRRQ